MSTLLLRLRGQCDVARTYRARLHSRVTIAGCISRGLIRADLRLERASTPVDPGRSQSDNDIACSTEVTSVTEKIVVLHTSLLSPCDIGWCHCAATTMIYQCYLTNAPCSQPRTTVIVAKRLQRHDRLRLSMANPRTLYQSQSSSASFSKEISTASLPRTATTRSSPTSSTSTSPTALPFSKDCPAQVDLEVSFSSTWGAVILFSEAAP